MNIETLKWDSLLCRFFSIPQHILPEIRSSAEIYGHVTNPEALAGIPIAGVSMCIVLNILVQSNSFCMDFFLAFFV